METHTETLAALLHNRECPFNYHCQNTDCVECLKIHMEKEGETNGV